MDPYLAMKHYVDFLSEILPSWCEASSKDARNRHKGMGPVFSTMADMGEEEDDTEEESVLHAFAGQDQVEDMVLLLDQGCEVDLRDGQGCTALHFGADRGAVAAMKLLMQRGADINATDLNGQTPLHYAYLCGRDEAVQLLLSNGADPTIMDKDGHTPEEVVDHQ